MRIDELVNIEHYINYGDGYPLHKHGREYHGLIYFVGEAETITIIGSKKFRNRGGDVIFLPQGLEYIVELETNYLECYVINFYGDDIPEPFKVFDCRDIVGQFQEAARLWRLHRDDEYYRLDCASIVYRLFAELLRRRDRASTPFRKKDRLSPVISRIHECYQLPDFRISGLAELIGVSQRELNRSFHDAYGESPKKYLDKLRLERAKALLIGDFTVSEVAVAAGFRDAYHFSAFFKRETGLSPSAFRADYRNRFRHSAQKNDM